MPATTMLAATSQAAPAGATADTPTPDVASAMAALSGVAVTNAESVAGSGARRTSTAQPSGDLTPAGTTPAGTTPAVAALVDALAAAGRAGTQSGSNQREGSTGRQVPGGTAMMATAGVSTTAALGSTVSTLAISVGTNSDTAKAGSATASMQAPAPGTHRPPLGLVDTRRLAIDLGDEGLGPLRLQALTQGGTLHMSLSAADPLVREALVRNSFELRRDLESAGVNLGSLDVGNFDRGHQGGTASQRDGDAASMRSSGEPTRPGGDGGRPARSDSSRSLRGSSTASNSLDLMI